MKKQSKQHYQHFDNSYLLSHALFLYRTGNLAEAETIGRKLLAVYPKNVDILNLLGIVQAQRNNWEEAIRFFEKIVKATPGNAMAYRNLGNALSEMKRYDEALKIYDKAIAIGSNDIEIYCNRTIALCALKKYEDALLNCDKVLKLAPNNADAYNTRAVILQAQKRYDDALTSCHKAIALEPNYAMAYNNCGIALNSLKQYSAALASYDKAITLNPNLVIAHSNRGLLLSGLGRYGEALASCDKAVTAKPDYADAHWNKSLVKLLLGEYEEGWKLYEWRWRRDNIDAIAIRPFQQPLWLGESNLAGKTILLHAEQGLGDTLQFCRYAPMVEELGAKVILEVQKPVTGLLATLKGTFNIIPRGKKLPDFDFHCPLMSLPLAFKTRLNSIPASINYLSVNQENLKLWQKRLGRKSRPRVGLAWFGSSKHLDDHRRSILLPTLAPLLQCDVEFHSVQKEVRTQDAGFLAESGIISHSKDLHDFIDTASLVSEMDIVISVDTSVAHLAGALGKPVWLLLPFSPDFRWLTERNDSPWYPTARLFRQPQPDDWEGAIAKVKEELVKLSQQVSYLPLPCEVKS